MPGGRDEDLIIIRGLPGSGKRAEARELWRQYGGQGTIIRAFNYHGPNGENFDRRNQGRSHKWAQRQAFEAMKRGDDPVIICNMNTELWMMYPYVKMGFHAGYYIKFVDMPEYDLDYLYRACGGNVPRNLLRRWEENYQEVYAGGCGVFQVLNDEYSNNWWENDEWLDERVDDLKYARNNRWTT